MVIEKVGPVRGGFFGGEGKPRAVSGSEVRESAGGVSTASGHSAEAARFMHKQEASGGIDPRTEDRQSKDEEQLV